MKAHIYKLDCITNLHVGNGDVNYNIVDNEIEKDPVTNYPVINSSGVKGAIRSHFRKMKDEIGEKDYNFIFGSDGEKGSRGEYKFLSAKLLSRPLRVSSGNYSYVSTTTNEIVSDFIDFSNSLGNSDYTYDLPDFNGEFIATEGINSIEGFTTETSDLSKLTPLIAKNTAVAKTNIFNKFDWPVIARNVLDENSISKNLWFEEFVPHKSQFYFAIITPRKENILDEHMINSVIQFGGNASIGYGLCKITKLGGSNE